VVEADDRTIHGRDCRRGVARGRRRLRRGRRATVSQWRAQGPKHLGGGDVAAHHDGRLARIEQRAVHLAQRIGVRRGTLDSSPAAGREYGESDANIVAAKAFSTRRRGIRHHLQQVVETLLTQSGHVRIEERGSLHQLTQQSQGRTEPGCRNVDRATRASQPASTPSVAPRRSAASVNSTPG